MDTTVVAETNGFERDQVDRARRYHRPLYLVRIAGLALGLGVLALLAFTPAGDALHGLVDELPWWAETIAFVALVLGLGAVVRLPLSFWRGYLHEKQWGFSTQTVLGWLGDRGKGLGIAVVLTSATVFGLVALARAFPSSWPVWAALGASALVLLLGFVAPVVLEPIFNRFAPLTDERLADDLRELARRAGVPVRDVLVADASRRTKKHNAYVSGLGRTRRVVLWDTLLARGEPREIRLVVAHELGHRRFRHVARWTAISMASAALFVVLVWALLRSGEVLDAIAAEGPSDPRIAPFVLLLSSSLELLALPFAMALSRRWERDADRFSLDLTRDPEAYEATHRNLALFNLGDLDPPRAAYVFFVSHPTAPERLAAGRRWAQGQASGMLTYHEADHGEAAR